ncbi:MAG TPA: pepsin/retropepsin-like aspartic protease family protein [Rhizomicrobium sp.]|nr:pepsin/retropepsin-like aspartic protease family protein [Rhizomicrobium sp.]
MHRAAIALLLVWLAPSTAIAAETASCSLKLVNSIPITMAAGGARPLVAVTINGTQKQFLLDTGGYATQISATAAEELKLPVTESYVKMLDLYGNVSTQAVKVDTFVLGRLGDRNTRMPILTLPENALYSGLLAADYMGKYDIELDFAGGKMNYFSSDHCPGKVVYWPAAAIAAVPMRFPDHHLILDVSLDGHPFRAIVDTGAPGTTLSMAEAKRVFDITAEDKDKDFEHVFQKLSFEGLEVANPRIAIIPDKVGSKDPNNSFVTGSRVKRIDDLDPTAPKMLIGMNILSKLHLYIAFSENKIYVTPGAPLAAVKPAQ